ncbi:ABC transporter permease [Aidingimonas lacisalsi]|uniref:ABC transporter permease n=1 Tax=Aidingimonas lacisalsi TaxID=2604086 RepID=UPI0011D2C2CC|nr:ABC transporter permease [Aidingimonas lacisalsi]
MIQYALDNIDLLGTRTLEHISLVSVAVGIATLTVVPIGIVITRNERVARAVLYAASIIITIPSIALFGIMIPILSLIGQGIGYVPAVIALLLYSQLPIIRNTYTDINNVDPALREAAAGIDMSPLQRLFRIELPNALYVIFAGIRTALAINVGTVPLAFLIGAGGLGELIFTGIDLHDPVMMLSGAIPTALLAIVVDALVATVAFIIVPRGVNPARA